MKISKLFARQIIDSRATPTIEVDLEIEGGFVGRVAIPSGASVGTYEAVELRDGVDSEYLGKSVKKAVENVQNLESEIMQLNPTSQTQLDEWLIAKDGTENKSNLGANTILGISLAYAHAVADMQKIPLYRYINQLYGNAEVKMPSPMFNIMNGGRHANWATDIQEFMIIVNHKDYAEQLETAAEIFTNLGLILEEAGLDTDVGNEGGYAPGFKDNKEALDFIVKAIERAGFKLGEDVSLALDVAASEFYNSEKNTYDLKTEKVSLSRAEWQERLQSWIDEYPLISIEDPFAEDDWSSWSEFTLRHSSNLQIVGDDLLVTNIKRIDEAISKKACNTLLVKPNQIGTLTETLQAMRKAESAGWKNIVSHRSGETEDVTIAHLAVGTGCGQIKTGAPSRGERTAKYNELLRIQEDL